jgi:hypothetical protein
MSALTRLEAEVSSWAEITVHPHRFAGREFRVGDAEVGHIPICAVSFSR